MAKKQLAIFILILSIAAFGAYFSLLPPKGLEIVPNIELTTTQGEKLNLDQIKKPLLVIFWATDCATCIEEMPHFSQLYRDLHGSGFSLIAVSMYYDRPDHVVAAMQKYKLPYPVVFDLDKKIVRSFALHPEVTPATFLIANGNRIVYHKIGKLPMDQLRSKITSMLAAQKNIR